MPEESTTPDLVELVRRSVDAVNRPDFDQFASFFGSDSVWDLSPMGLGIHQGSSAVRAFVEDWQGSYEKFELALEEVLDIGNEVVLPWSFSTPPDRQHRRGSDALRIGQLAGRGAV
jgi:hypothetical protein